MHVANGTRCNQIFDIDVNGRNFLARVIKVVLSGIHPAYVSMQYGYNVPKHVASLHKMSHVFRVGISAG